MALSIDVSPYTLEGVVAGDNYFTHYKAKNEGGEEFFITEFYPSYMVQRNEETNALEVSETFTNEFFESRLEFLHRAEQYGQIRDPSLHPCHEVFQRNNTVYIVRRTTNMTTVEQYMGNQQMDFDEAFHFIRPALLSLAQAAEQNLLFKLTIKDFRVNSFKQLVSCGQPCWETDFHPTLRQISRLYYKLITGVEAAESNTPGFSVYGLTIPPRIENLILEVLNGEILYGSLYDFFKQFKALVDGSSEAPQKDGTRTLMYMKAAAAVLVVVFLVSTVFLARRAVDTYRAGTFWTNPDLFAGTLIAESPPLDFSDITLTHPRSSMDALTGSFGLHDGFLFFRDSQGIKRRRVEDMMVIPGAMGVLGVHDDQVVRFGAKASFITGHGSFVYFVDVGSDGAIYRMRVNGDEHERISDFPALNLAVLGDYLYFTRPDMNNQLFRFDLNTMNYELVWGMPVFATLPDAGNLLYVLAGTPGTEDSGLYRLDLTYIEITPLAGGVGKILRKFMGTVFYLDMHGRINTISPIGIRDTLPLENVRSFDVFFQWVIFTEEGRHAPRAFDMITGRFFTLSHTEWVSYVWIREATIYGIDHRNPQLVHIFNLPS